MKIYNEDIPDYRNDNNETHTVWIDYTNYKGVREWRHIQPRYIWFGTNNWHEGEQWFISAFAIDRDRSHRMFAMKNVHAWSHAKP